MSLPSPGPAGIAVDRPRAAAADWLVLCKPRLNSLVVATTLGGAWLGSRGEAPAALLLHAAGGTALAACGASALNMVMERGTDARMERTRDRPVPAGRVSPAEGAAFGAALTAAGIAWLALGTGLPAAVLAFLTVLVYLAVYTPLKGRSASNTLVGAVPGALPPLIGWAAAGRGLDAGAWTLFAVLYLWQIPHFLSIAWLYREDYRRAGLVMLPGLDGDGEAAGRHALRYALTLVPVPLFALVAGLAGGAVFAAGAVLLGLGYAFAARSFSRARTDASARTLLRASLLYLPLLFGLLILGQARLPAAEEPLPVLGEVPDFAFTERSGRAVARDDLRGKAWVADFVFTSCAGTCPAMSLRMGEVHEALRREPDVLCVTFSTDPDRDTLDVLRGYALRWSATGDRWLFLRGPQAEVLSLQHGGFGMGSPTDPFLHSERFVLVDGRGRIRGFYHGIDPSGVADLLRDFRRLRAEEGA